MEVIRAANNIDYVIAKIDEWGSLQEKLVVAIDGFSGAGKSSLLEQIKKKASVVAISLDDFVYEFEYRKSCVGKSSLPEAELAECWFRFDDVIGLLDSFRFGRQEATVAKYDFFTNAVGPSEKVDLSPNVLIVDGIFTIGKLRNRHLVDRSILVLSDWREADSRRISRERARWGERFRGDDDPDSYITLFRRSFEQYLLSECPVERADLVVLN